MIGRSTRSSSILVGLALSAISSAVAQLPPKASVARVVDSLAKDFIASRGAPGVSIAVVRDRDTLVMAGWGKADLENDVMATAHTVYRIGSITKQFTASAVMQLVEQGKVRLDDSIGSYLPSLPAAWHAVTVRQLLNHTSGIPSYTDIGPRWIRRWGEEMPPDTLVALTAGDTLWFKPGSSWRYDNSGYVVLGMLVSKVAERPWATDIVERFAKPLGLADTRNCDTRSIIKHRAQGYEPAQGEWVNAQYLAMSQPYAAGALCSSVGDLARWNRALGSGQVVKPASYATMTTPEGAAATAALKYGFGLARDTLAGRTVISHGGGINGFITSNAWFPAERLSVTVLTNSGAARPDGLLAQVARAALGAPLLRPPAKVAITAAELAKYVGVYELKVGAQSVDFAFSERNGELYAQLATQNPIPLTYIGNDTFGASVDPTLRIAFTLESGKASRISLKQGGLTAEGARK
ncbi:MAG TPA: serine hydrolase [Gemmatimonadaceae bacterium]|jgi:CubicO group peptidase (beta-lactamase class C family)|nr:serine hydrolase [Gemmatimonadaceae bacterium]